MPEKGRAHSHQGEGEGHQLHALPEVGGSRKVLLVGINQQRRAVRQLHGRGATPAGDNDQLNRRLRVPSPQVEGVFGRQAVVGAKTVAQVCAGKPPKMGVPEGRVTRFRLGCG